MASHSPKYMEREIRQLDLLSQFGLEFRHARGSDNKVADTLPRTESSLQFPTDIDYVEQRGSIRSHGVPNVVILPFDDNTLVACDQSTGLPKPVVPVPLRRTFSKN